MQKLAKYQLTVFLWILCASSAIGAGYTNTFDAPFDYVANGIIGDTNWDGVYLRGGDIAGGSIGGSGSGTQNVANSTSPFPTFLNLRNAGGDWSGADNDGFFIYKVVQGDFDVSVQSMPATLSGGTAYDNRAFNFAGLQIRAHHTNNSGAAYSTTVTNANAENSYRLWRFHGSGIDGQIRRSTNGTDGQFTYAADPGNVRTNESRFYRIVRQNETNFFFYWKANVGDAWLQITNGATTTNGVAIRSDWAGVNLQVGIAQAAFNTAARDAVFDDFELSGPNVTFPTLPVAAPSAITFTPVNSNSISISWATNGGDGSLVLVRANGLHITSPVQGTVYTGDTNFQSTNSFLGAARVIHVGPGTNVTVTGLGGSNNTYNVAVFTYSGSGAATVYNTASPATNSTIGPGSVSSVTFTVSPTSIPANGVSVATVTATYNSGDSYNVSADTSTIWTSSDPTVILAANGLLTGLTNGSSEITATYAGVTGTNIVSVHQPAFRDEFSSNHDYVATGAVGSIWDGVYLGAGDVPLQIAGNFGAQPGVTSIADANLSSNGVLTVTHRQTGWEGNDNDGFFLFKRVPGDFQVAVHIHTFLPNEAFHMSGLMARLFTPAGGAAGTANGAFPNGRENHVRWSRFDQFGISTTARRNLNGGNQVFNSTDGETTSFWLLMVRSSTNFTFFKKVNANDGWSPVPGSARVQPDATNGVAMQVGLGASTFDSGLNFRTVRFEHFMLDAANLSLATPMAGPTNLTSAANPDGSMTVSWTPAAGSVGTLVVMRARTNVNVQPLNGVTYTGNAFFGLGSNLGSSNYVVHAGSGSSVIVSNLLPGTTYFGAAYAIYGSGVTTTYSLLSPSTSSALALGAVQSISFALPAGTTLLNGGVLPFSSTAFYLNGISNDVTSQVTISSDPPGWVVGTNGTLTGLTNGSVNVSIVFAEKTNTTALTVVSPDYADDFSVSNDFIANGVTGTIWDGLYLGSSSVHPLNSISGGTADGVDGAGFTSICDANISSNSLLTVQATSTTWVGGVNDGFFLFKHVPGDFQAAVHMNSIPKDANGVGTVPNLFAGLMGRAYGNTNILDGSPYNGSEDWVYWAEFERFNDSTEARMALNGADTEFPIFDGATNDFWLLIRRANGTNFTFYRRVQPTDPWVPQPSTTINRPDLATVPLQVGLFHSVYAANSGLVQFDSFMLNASDPSLRATGAGGNVSLNYPAVPGLVVQQTLSLSPTNWQPISGTLGTTNGINTMTLPTTNAATFFRLVQP